METFQSPPKSISWIFDEPCMVMGVDVNHPESANPNSVFSGPSVAAVVASMDGKLGQYCAHISTCNAREEPVGNLQRAMSTLLDTFMSRNQGRYPKRIIIYRDGLSDNQYEQILEKELAAYKDALVAKGFNEEAIKICIVLCQKRHHTRLVYQHDQGNRNPDEKEYINPCVGLVVDGRNMLNKNPDELGDGDTVGAITSPGINEFYLNSHAAVPGTSKPCKYVLVYDEVGLKVRNKT